MARTLCFAFGITVNSNMNQSQTKFPALILALFCLAMFNGCSDRRDFDWAKYRKESQPANSSMVRLPANGGMMLYGSGANFGSGVGYGSAMPYGSGAFGSGMMPYGSGMMPFGSGQMMPFGSGAMPYGSGMMMPFGSGQPAIYPNSAIPTGTAFGSGS